MIEPSSCFKVTQPARIVYHREAHVFHLGIDKDISNWKTIEMKFATHTKAFLRLNGFTDLSEALPHDMYVLDVQEDKFNILVIVFALVPATFQSVGISIHLVRKSFSWKCMEKFPTISFQSSYFTFGLAS